MRDEQSRQRSTEVIIDGKVMPLAGGDSAYLRQVAAYIDNKIAELRQNRAYARQNSERRAQILWLNLADDCLQARAESAELKEEAAAHASEVYALKRELVEQRLRMETLQKATGDEAADADLAAEKQKLEEKLAAAEKDKEALTADKERLMARVHELEEALEAEKKRSRELETELDELLSK